MRKKKIFSVLLAVVMVLTGFTLPGNVRLEGDEQGASLLQSVDAATTYAESVTLYGMNSTYEEVLTIPSGYAQSYQIEDSDAVSYSVYSGSTVKVSSDGLIEPKYTTWYKSGYFYTTSYIEGASSYDELNTGSSVVKVTTSSGYYLISVTVEDYTDVYVDEIIDAYIAENITSDMTDLEIMDAICAFPASYNYSASYSSYKGMIIYGGGDCWASTGLIIETCDRLGITAWRRNGNKDSGAGSGHRNAMALLNGVYYELEAGYTGTAPRAYDVTVRTSLFSTRNVTGGVEVYQYDGLITGAYELEIPEEINGKTVVSIGDSFAVSDSYLTKVTIPDTVTSIGKSAFNTCSSLTDLNIPASVSEIDNFAFTNCNSLSNFTCDSDNPYYTIVDGVLYDKSMTTVYFAPYVSEIVLPDTVETIYEYSLYYNKNLTNLYIPSSVTYIGEGAMGYCTALTTVEFEEGGTSLDMESYVFYGCSKLESVELPSGLTEIPTYTFYGCSKLTKVEIPASVTSIDDYAFAYCTGLTDVYYLGTESEWNEITIGSENTYLTAATIHYATEMPDYILGDVDGNGEPDYEDAMLILQYDVGSVSFDATQLLAGDVTGDGKVDSQDAMLILSLDAGIITEF